jgi:hypothetical protein
MRALNLYALHTSPSREIRRDLIQAVIITICFNRQKDVRYGCEKSESRGLGKARVASNCSLNSDLLIGDGG